MHENKKVAKRTTGGPFKPGGLEHKARKNPAVAAWFHPNSLLMSTKNTEKEYQIPNIIDRFMKETPTITSRRRPEALSPYDRSGEPADRRLSAKG
jgi:hypothetical protein